MSAVNRNRHAFYESIAQLSRRRIRGVRLRDIWSRDMSLLVLTILVVFTIVLYRALQ